MPAIYLYAELLLHIRQVAVLAILPTPVDASTHIGISADSRTLSLEHGGVRAIAELPCPVLGIANRREDTSQTELSFRLQPSGAARLPTPVKNPSDESPWPAASLAANTQIACKGCKKLLARPISNFKDLPSGGWAEMMELWHCNKPSTSTTPASGDDSSSSSIKGYSASNVIGPSPGTALVDVSHFVLADEDCIGIQVGSPSSTPASPPATSSGAASTARPSSVRSAPSPSNSTSNVGRAKKTATTAPPFRATTLAGLKQYHEYLQQSKAQKDQEEEQVSLDSRSESASVKTSVCVDFFPAVVWSPTPRWPKKISFGLCLCNHTSMFLTRLSLPRLCFAPFERCLIGQLSHNASHACFLSLHLLHDNFVSRLYACLQTYSKQQTNSPEHLLVCTECKQPVGIEDKGVVGSVRLFKWALALQSSDKRLSKFVSAFKRSGDGAWKTNSIQRIVGAQLLALIEEQAVYKFLCYSGDIEDAKDALLVKHPLSYSLSRVFLILPCPLLFPQPCVMQIPCVRSSFPGPSPQEICRT